MTTAYGTALVAARSSGSVQPRLAALLPGIPIRALPLVPAQQVVRQAMRNALDQLARPDRSQVPAFVAAAPYAAYAATYFAERHEDPGRRLRPSHSIQMECSRLVQGLDDDLDQANRWTGDLVFLCTPERDVRQTVRSAEAAVATGAPAALICDITVAPRGLDGKAAALSAAAMLLVRAPACSTTGDLAPWPPATTERQNTAAGAPA